jgi:hypothetical protein
MVGSIVGANLLRVVFSRDHGYGYAGPWNLGIGLLVALSGKLKA